MSDDRASHWETIYRTKTEDQVSWFQQTPEPSLTLLELAGATPDAVIVDIGAGASHLVDVLIGRGFDDVTVLDLSQAALDADHTRLGPDASRVTWIRSDVTDWQPERNYDIWHDRAAFHFLTDAVDQAAYAAVLKRAVKAGGHAIIGTFAPDGPEKCSGLPIVRHDADSIGKLLGGSFELIDTRRHEHRTPWDSVQLFQFSTFRKQG
ncbi:class I SAM-dependent methyltransferase [Aminobacter aminovorans]|uniref:class I SAM-dependent methyltransferase n=1 Tax=Aminobacter aminovorans TaxID=83263 RepID=UPI00285D8A12|nr:class I SAM-dependent methyltransferase [Aminobacter aminovorans]MDR7224961.1 SAM-dependent methyltransferase [Aminobacter aminovorans]